MDNKLTTEIIENFLKDFEISNYYSQGLKKRKLEVLRQIVEYLNYKYKEAVVLFDEEKDEFTISGTKEQQETILETLKEIVIVK